MGIFLSGGALIDFDFTFFVQAAIFFLVFFILRAWVFKPMVALFEAREEAIEGSRIEAKRMREEADEKSGAFDDKMRSLRQSAQEERDRLRSEGMKAEQEILDKVRQESQRTLADAEIRLDKESTRIREELRGTVPDLAQGIVGKLLGREAA